MKGDERVGLIDRMTFKAMFSADWLFGQEHVAKLLPERWEKIHHRMFATASRTGDGGVYPVERRSELTPQEFRQRYFVPGIPVVLEGAAAEWPAIKKWTPDYFSLLCGHEETKVLDGRNWTVNRDAGQEAVSTAEKLRTDSRPPTECGRRRRLVRRLHGVAGDARRPPTGSGSLVRPAVRAHEPAHPMAAEHPREDVRRWSRVLRPRFTAPA